MEVESFWAIVISAVFCWEVFMDSRIGVAIGVALQVLPVDFEDFKSMKNLEDLEDFVVWHTG